MNFLPSARPSFRRLSSLVRIGDVTVGGDSPIRIQSMLTPPTRRMWLPVSRNRALGSCGLRDHPTHGAKPESGGRASAHPQGDAGVWRLASTGGRHPLQPTARGCGLRVCRESPHQSRKLRGSQEFEIREYTDAQYAEELERVEATLLPLITSLKSTDAPCASAQPRLALRPCDEPLR